MAEAGRPTVFTEDTLQKLESAFADGLNNREACFLADISESAFYAYCKENPELKERFELLQDSIKIQAKRNIAKRIRDQDPNDSKWYLERRVKEFNPKQETDITSGGKEINPVLVKFIDGSENEDNRDTSGVQEAIQE